jgi:hypothetical protein
MQHKCRNSRARASVGARPCLRQNVASASSWAARLFEEAQRVCVPAQIMITCGAMRIFLRRRPFRAAIVCCLTVCQAYLLCVATLHQHPLTAFVGGASPGVSQGSSQPRPAMATELTCAICQVVRHSLALPVTGSLALHAAASVSRLLLSCPVDYHSCQAIVVFGRAPPLS